MRLLTFIFFITLIPFKQPLANDADSPFTIAYHEGGKPWAWEDKGKARGILIDITEEALRNRMQKKVKHYFYPWRRAQKLVESGKIDALITNYTQQRQTYSIASNTYVTDIKRMIFVRENSRLIPELLKIKQLSQLSHFSMGNYIGNNWAEKKLKHFNIQWAGNVEAALKMLSAGRFDIYLGNPVSTAYKLKVLKIQNIVALPVLMSDIKSSKFKLLINKNSDHVALIPEFDKTIIKMKNDGSLQRIFNQYKTIAP